MTAVPFVISTLMMYHELKRLSVDELYGAWYEHSLTLIKKSNHRDEFAPTVGGRVTHQEFNFGSAKRARAR